MTNKMDNAKTKPTKRVPTMQRCFNCGAELGVYVRYYADRDTCGSRECEGVARDEERAELDNARLDAEDDGYSRYR